MDLLLLCTLSFFVGMGVYFVIYYLLQYVLIRRSIFQINKFCKAKFRGRFPYKLVELTCGQSADDVTRYEFRFRSYLPFGWYSWGCYFEITNSGDIVYERACKLPASKLFDATYVGHFDGEAREIVFVAKSS